MIENKKAISQAEAEEEEEEEEEEPKEEEPKEKGRGQRQGGPTTEQAVARPTCPTLRVFPAETRLTVYRRLDIRNYC